MRSFDVYLVLATIWLACSFIVTKPFAWFACVLMGGLWTFLGFMVYQTEKKLAESLLSEHLDKDLIGKGRPKRKKSKR